MSRKKIVAGNWKMNLDREGAMKLVSEAVNMLNDEVKGDALVVFCPSFVHLSTAKSLFQSAKNVFLGAQDCSAKTSGAFTGEISAPMLKSYGADFVIIGHSERRQYHGETDALLAEKVNQALAVGLQPIFCCGEVLAERNAGKHTEVVTNQLTNALFHLSAEQFSKIVIAYEPVWAIGTGVTASTEQAQEMHAVIRKHLASKYGEAAAQATSILYGGSCKPDNAKELFACPDVDGGLIGGASLKSRDFVDIVKSF